MKGKEDKAARTAKRAPQSFMEAASDFERMKVDEIRRSRAVAWRIASVATGLCAVSIVSVLIALLMRTEPEPVVLRVDNSTGDATMLRSVRDASDHYDEVVNKFWLGQYIRMCEGYDWYLIGEEVEGCKLMSSDAIAKEHETKVRAPTAPLEVLKDRGKIVAKVTSIVLLSDETAQVRFTTEKVGTSGSNDDSSPVQKWIGTVAYQFEPSLRMTDQQRLVNPLGFKAYGYRVDPEVVQ